ncbi:engulfment and cell motility protein 3 isoform X2 [Falco cherrug]|uniref:engulfment and cell motility protein 3 isoform X2 n=1 Tax=Falco peregrinus TaxID=8954 RepID=UPI00247A73A6|nr:engulfment and cell motility protein 3 isoform X2 [Falco peregrinus]XP_055582722.1 engulfment and cell motility protein 3 isoform X2 [Falco cherrug]
MDSEPRDVDLQVGSLPVAAASSSVARVWCMCNSPCRISLSTGSWASLQRSFPPLPGLRRPSTGRAPAQRSGSCAPRDWARPEGGPGLAAEVGLAARVSSGEEAGPAWAAAGTSIEGDGGGRASGRQRGPCGRRWQRRPGTAARRGGEPSGAGAAAGAMPPPKDVVKIAIQMVGAIPQLIELQQTKPLASVLKDVCDAWSLPNAERYALQYADGRQTYITESNRGEIKNGSILQLTTSPDQEAERLYSGIQSNNLDVKTDSLKKLASLSQDVTFAQEFINRNGLKQIFSIVEEGNDTGEMLVHTLKAFMELMEHDFVSWETLSAAFIKKVVSYVNMNAVDASIQQLSLSILENMVPTSRLLFELVKKEVTLDRLLTHLQVTDAQLQLKAMALLIALLLAATDAERRDMMDYLREKNIRQFIHKNIIHSSEPLGDEMAHYLYVLQSVSLNLCERRMRTSMDPYSQEQRELLQSLRQTAFESEGEAPASNFSTERRRSLCAKEFRKLGFMNNSNPAEDLRRAPPGLLALDNMVYFSRHTPNAYSRDHFFEELFCICIQLVNKTWKEMRATQEDFDKVLQVVREQITRTLSLKPTSLELFKTRVNALNYSEILKLRQTERLHQEETLAVPVLELRERLKPELLELIRQQRLLHLCKGTLFRKISSRRRQDKLWYCRLSPNHKVLHYGGVEEGVHSPPIESLPEKIPVADMKMLLVGKECLHTKEKSSGKQNKDVLELAFSIVYDVEEYCLSFVAPTRYEFCLWTDGLNVLLGKEMTSERTQTDLDVLLSMELKLRLLDLENISIPDTPPPIPKPPSNLNFCYDFSHAEQ